MYSINRKMTLSPVTQEDKSAIMYVQTCGETNKEEAHRIRILNECPEPAAWFGKTLDFPKIR